MATVALKSIDQIWAILEELKNEDKIALAVRLMDSLLTKKTVNVEKEELTPQKDEGWRKLSGAWADDGQSAEDLIKFLRDSRFTNRQIEPFD